MRQAVLVDSCKFSVEEMPKPEPKTEEAKRSFEAFGKAYFGLPPSAILGHPLSGEVTETRPVEELYKPGDRITIRGAGGYADYAVALGLGGHPLSRVVSPLPDEVSNRDAALVER